MWDLSFWQNLPQIFNFGASLSRGKFVGRNLEQIQVEGCKTSVCVQLQLGANFALAAKYYSPRDTSSASHLTHSLRPTCHSTCPLPQRVLLSKRTSRLYESHESSRAAPILREQSDFANFEVLNGQETSTFEKNRTSSRLTVQHVKP